MKFISIRAKDGLFSVDISAERFSGGSCRLFRYIGDALIWITEQGEQVNGWPNLENRDWSKGDFQSWNVVTW